MCRNNVFKKSFPPSATCCSSGYNRAENNNNKNSVWKDYKNKHG